MNLVHTCLLYERFFTVLLIDNEKNAVTLTHGAQKNMHLW